MGTKRKFAMSASVPGIEAATSGTARCGGGAPRCCPGRGTLPAAPSGTTARTFDVERLSASAALAVMALAAAAWKRPTILANQKVSNLRSESPAAAQRPR